MQKYHKKINKSPTDDEIVGFASTLNGKSSYISPGAKLNLKSKIAPKTKVSTVSIYTGKDFYYETFVFGGRFDNQQIGDNVDKKIDAYKNHVWGIFSVWIGNFIYWWNKFFGGKDV